jgi:hypothetical protein
VSAVKKPSTAYQKLYGTSSSPEKKAVEDLTQKINGLLNSKPEMARKAALILERWMRQKTK